MAAMEFDFTEEHYRKERERSDHPLRQAEPMGRQESEREEEKEERLRNPLSGYESSEAERKEKKVPKEQLLLKGRNQRFSSGYDKDGKLTIVFSRDKNDGEVKDQETIKRERSSSMKEDRKYLKAGIHNPKKSAVLLEDREQKRKQFLMGRAAKAIDKPGEMLIEEAFPFLSQTREQEEIRTLEDEARKHSMDRETVELCREEADRLHKDVMAKERERKALLKKMVSQVKPEEKTGKTEPVFGWLSEKQTENEEDSDKNEENSGENNKNSPDVK